MASESKKTRLFSRDETVLREGALTDVMLRTTPSHPILTATEEAELIEAKSQLENIIKEFESKMNLLETMLHANQSKRIKTKLQLQKPDGTTSITKPEDIQKICKNLQEKAMEWILFLSGKISKLLQARQFKRAKSEFNSLLLYSMRVNGADHLETLKIQMSYAIAQCSDPNASSEDDISLLQKTIEQLEKKLPESNGAELTSIKRYMARGYYTLAQWCLLKENRLEAAYRFADVSENLRKEYGASEEELQKIHFLKGRIENRKGNTSGSKQILMERYQDLSQTNKLSSDLMPLLEDLIGIAEKENNNEKQSELLIHLLNIQKHLQLTERDILQTQLRLLNVMNLRLCEKEYWTLMDCIEKRLNKIPVTEQSMQIGLFYQQLAQTRMVFLPQEWSKVKKQNYHRKTFEIIYKAKLHLDTAQTTLIAATAIAGLAILQEKCRTAIDFFSDLNPRFTGEPIHPEDAEALKLESTDETKNKPESSTQEHLMKLSDFSSEVNHSLVSETNQVLTATEFEKLPEKGTINPYRLRTAQGGINSAFRDGKLLEQAKQGLIDNPNFTNQIPPIEIGIHEGEVYSFDTRRLIVHQQAREENPEVVIRYKKISGAYLQQRIQAIFSPRPWKGFVTAIRFGGKGSESHPYVNPALRNQLDGKVQKEFKRFPSIRKEAADDSNGFPVLQQKAKKLYNFLKKRAKDGSTSSLKIVKEAERIGKLEGEDAAYNYLLGKKTGSLLPPNSGLDSNSR